MMYIYIYTYWNYIGSQLQNSCDDEGPHMQKLTVYKYMHIDMFSYNEHMIYIYIDMYICATVVPDPSMEHLK